MNCPSCKNHMVTRQATKFGQEYLYCRTCRKELSELATESIPTLPKGSMNLEISAETSAKEIGALRQTIKGDLVFLLEEYDINSVSSHDLDRLASDFDIRRS